MSDRAPRSLAEIRFYVTRAVAGAGAPFGIGEEVAEAVVRMSASGAMNWPMFAAALQALGTGRSSADLKVTDKPVSALLAGPAMAWTVDDQDLHMAVDTPDLAAEFASCLRPDNEAVPPPGGVTPDAEAWSIVQRWFNECLVPSNAESRLSGAGAGLVEKD
jgi:hypothetical protein